MKQPRPFGSSPTPTILRVLVWVLILFLAVNSVQAQAPRWMAPAWADTLLNPVNNQVTATGSGKLLFNAECISCHGYSGKGDGESGFGLNTPPRDLTDKEHAALTDGAVWWKITYGKSPMPAYQKTYTDLQRWQLVNYLRELQRIDKESVEKNTKRKTKR